MGGKSEMRERERERLIDCLLGTKDSRASVVLLVPILKK